MKINKQLIITWIFLFLISPIPIYIGLAPHTPKINLTPPIAGHLYMLVYLTDIKNIKLNYGEVL